MAQHKFTKKEILELVAALGLDAELVDDDALSDLVTTKGTEKEITHDALIKMVDGSRRPIIEQSLRTELETDINKHVAGKTTAAVRKEISALTGVPADLIEGKDRKEAMQIGLAHYAKSLGVDKESAADQLQQVIAAKDKEVETERQGRSADKLAYEKEISSFGVKNVLSGLYANAKGIDPAANKEILQNDFKDYIERTYHVKLTEDGKGVTLFDAKNPANLALNQAGTQAVKLEDIHKQYHTERGQWREDNRNINPANPIPSVKDYAVKDDQGRVVSAIEQRDTALEAYFAQP